MHAHIAPLPSLPRIANRRLDNVVDFLVCLGGDGVILHAGSMFRRALPPVLSFHLGSMGFMTNHGFDDFKKDLRSVSGGGGQGWGASLGLLGRLRRNRAGGRERDDVKRTLHPRTHLSLPPPPPFSKQLIYGCQNLETCGSLDSMDSPSSNKLGVMVTLRMRLECSVLRAGQTQPDQVYQVLNEVVVDRGSSSFLTNIECYIAGRLITRVQVRGCGGGSGGLREREPAAGFLLADGCSKQRSAPHPPPSPHHLTLNSTPPSPPPSPDPPAHP